MLDGLNWITLGLGVAFAAAGLHYYGWVFGVGSKLDGMKRITMNRTMARLRGKHSQRDPSEEVEQALNDVLNGIPTFDDVPDDDLLLPEVRQPQGRRSQPGGQAPMRLR